MAGFLKSALNVFGIGSKGGDSGYLKDMTLEQFLAEIASLTGHEIEFTAGEREGSTHHFEISGADTEEFLGSSSEVLEALSHLSLRFVRRKNGDAPEVTGADSTAPSEQIRITFDSGEFRTQKVEGLRELAASKRSKVMEAGGKPAYINALGPADRKVIHTYVSEVGDVVSESIGTGYFKRIRIRLKDDNRPRAEGGGQRAQGSGGNGPRRGGGQGRGPRGPGGGQGRDGQNRGGQRRGPGQGNGGNSYNGNRDNFAGGNEVNGNVFRPEAPEDDRDDNIGNRLKPGEEPLFGYTGGNESDRG